MTFIIVLGVFTGGFLIWCSLQGPGRSLKYVVISPRLLRDWKKQRPSLVIIKLQDAGKDAASESLLVAPKQLNGLLRWIPPQTTLVLCGKRKIDICRAEIEWTLLTVGIDVVYILDEDAGSSAGSTSPDLVTHGHGNLDWLA